MKFSVLTIILCFILSIAYCDTIPLKGRVDDLERNVKQIDANQLNYKIEKDLLKETYSNSYERINLGITVVLGLIGLAGFFGIRSITDVKKEYVQELAELKVIKEKFELKSKEIDVQKDKYETGLELLIKENQEQNRKIQFIELKDKAVTYFKDKVFASSLEFAEAALDIKSDDLTLLTLKARAYCNLNRYKDALEIYRNIVASVSNESTPLCNLVECLYFVNEIPEAKALLTANPTLFTEGDEIKAIAIFNMIELYYLGDSEALKATALNYITAENLNDVQVPMKGWTLEETKYFIAHQPSNPLKPILQNLIWYLDGQLKGSDLLNRIGLTLPESVPNPSPES